MAEIKRVGEGLEIDQDLAFQRRDWRAERIGWAVMLLIVLAGLSGILGRGPLAGAQAGREGEPLQLAYDRIVRAHSPARLEFTIGPDAIADGETRLAISRDFVQGLQIQHITPEPSAVHAGPDALTYVFAATEPGGPVTIVFDVEADAYLRRSGWASVAGAAPVSFTQLVLP